MKAIKDTFRKTGVIAWYEVKQWKNDSRIWMIFLIELVLLLRGLIGFTIYGLLNGTRTTPWLVTLLFSDASGNIGLMKIMIYMGVIVLFCNAPFINTQTPYVLLRGKRKSWICGEIAYVFLAAFLYMLLLAVAACVVTLPAASTSELWGGSVYRLETEYYGGGSSIYTTYIYGTIIPHNVIKKIYPDAAFLYTFIVGWLSFVFIGMIIFTANMKSNSKNMGIVLAAGLVLLDPVVNLFASYGVFYQGLLLISPVSWSSIEHLQLVSGMGALSIAYVILVYMAAIVIMIGLVRYWGRKIEITTL